MARRSIKKSRYIFAFVITLLIFSLGFLLGIVTNDYKLSEIEKVYQKQSADLESLQFQYTFLNEHMPVEGNETCTVIEATLENNLRTLGGFQERIEFYKVNSNIVNLNDYEYNILKRKYIIANLRYWLLAEKNRQICNSDTVSVLYFYAQDCGECNNQGFILSQLKNIFGDNLLVFPIDASVDEPMIDILRREYKIYSFPSIIIEGETYGNFMGKKGILKIICPLFKKKYEICDPYV